MCVFSDLHFVLAAREYFQIDWLALSRIYSPINPYESNSHAVNFGSYDFGITADVKLRAQVSAQAHWRLSVVNREPYY